MKKILSVCVALIMVVGMSFTAFAAPGTFVSSPSGNPAPELVEATVDSEDCAADVVITPYSERDTLPDDLREQLEDAYDSIASSTDLTELNSDLSDLAANNNIPGSSLAVSDLFDAHYIDCEEHDGHGNFNITLKPETLKNFVGLMQYVNGKWMLIKNAKVTGNGDHLAFSTDTLSPLAIVVNADAGEASIQTGDNSNIIIYAVIMVISALAIVFILRRSKKQID